MYIDFVFLFYGIAVVTACFSLVITGFLSVRNGGSGRRFCMSFLLFSVVCALTILLYFWFYYREVVHDNPEVDLPLRILDYILCNLVFFSWVSAAESISNEKKGDLRLVKGALVLTVLIIAASVYITTAFMGVYYNIDNEAVRRIWSVCEAVFTVLTSAVILCGCVRCVKRTADRPRAVYAAAVSALLIIWRVIQNVVDVGLFAGKYGKSAWSVELPDSTGVLFFLVGLATCIFVFREQSRLMPHSDGGAVPADDVQTAKKEDEKERFDHTAEACGLTAREREVLELLCRGCTNPEIADALFVSVNTVKKHVKNIYRKLGVSSRTEAVHRVYLP